MESLYYDDLWIGQVRKVGRRRVSREEIIRFATEWDPQPFHVDEAAARESVFEGLSASSCHTYAISSRIFHDSQLPKLRTAAMLGMQVRFPTPLRPDDEISLTETVLELRRSKSRPGVGVVTSRGELTNAKGEPVMVLESTYLVERRDAGSLQKRTADD